ncbi:MAG TPA: FHA domain-containing protein, partial [Albitalea sp.]
MQAASTLHAPPASAWCLRFLSGAVRGRTIALKHGSNVVGSGGDCDVMLPGGDVLPQHLVFTVGELVVSVQKIGLAAAQLNGEALKPQRRSVVAGDVLSVGQIDFQLDRVAAAGDQDERMLAWSESVLPPAAGEAHAAAPARDTNRWLIAGVAALAVASAAVAGLSMRGADGPARAAPDTLDLAGIERVLSGFPEVEAIAGSHGSVTLRGYVESKARRHALQQAVAPFGSRVGVNVLSAEEMVEQARRFVTDPGVTIAYTGQGRLQVSGSAENEAVRLQIRRLAEDLHPVVLVTDRVDYRAASTHDEGADARAQWAAWQELLPARMVGITEDANGLRHIQLANGSRYYEGAVLRSGAELRRIDADGLVLSGGAA